MVKKYVIEESLKFKSEKIKLGFLPIGQRKVPKVKCEKGKNVIIEYEDKTSNKGHIKCNAGILNC